MQKKSLITMEKILQKEKQLLSTMNLDESADITHLDNNDEDILKIEDIVNLNDPIFVTSENVIINECTQERRTETMNYVAEDIVQEFLAESEDTSLIKCLYCTWLFDFM